MQQVLVLTNNDDFTGAVEALLDQQGASEVCRVKPRRIKVAPADQTAEEGAQRARRVQELPRVGSHVVVVDGDSYSVTPPRAGIHHVVVVGGPGIPWDDLLPALCRIEAYLSLVEMFH